VWLVELQNCKEKLQSFDVSGRGGDESEKKISKVISVTGRRGS
jgi:hypothetical protein